MVSFVDRKITSSQFSFVISSNFINESPIHLNCVEIIPYPAAKNNKRTSLVLADKRGFFVGGDGGIRTHGPAHHQSNDFESFSL